MSISLVVRSSIEKKRIELFRRLLPDRRLTALNLQKSTFAENSLQGDVCSADSTEMLMCICVSSCNLFYMPADQRGIAVACTFCTSSNQREFPAEVNIHFPGLRNAERHGVFVFPRLLICLDCGSSSFTMPTSQLAHLAGASTPQPNHGCQPIA